MGHSPDRRSTRTSTATSIAWHAATAVRVRPADTSAPASAAGGLAGGEASWSKAKDTAGNWHLLYSAPDGSVHDTTVTTASTGATFSNDRVLYTANVLG